MSTVHAPTPVRWPRMTKLATSALVLGLLALPLALAVYPGILLGGLAVLLGLAGLVRTRRGRALGRARAGIGLVAGLVAVAIALSLGWQGRHTFQACEDRLGHRPGLAELKTCVRDGL